MKTVESPNAAAAVLLDFAIASSSSASLFTIVIPIPPPPAEALTITGYPIASANAFASSWLVDCVHGRTGTPASCIACLESSFEPIMRMVSSDGPINAKPAFFTAPENAAFSARKPYPG